MMILHSCFVLFFLIEVDEENTLFILCKVARGISFLDFNLSLILQQSDRFLSVFLNIRYKEVLTFLQISKIYSLTLHIMGGWIPPPPRFLDSGAFNIDLRGPRFWYNSYFIVAM